MRRPGGQWTDRASSSSALTAMICGLETVPNQCRLGDLFCLRAGGGAATSADTRDSSRPGATSSSLATSAANRHSSGLNRLDSSRRSVRALFAFLAALRSFSDSCFFVFLRTGSSVGSPDGDDSGSTVDGGTAVIMAVTASIDVRGTLAGGAGTTRPPLPVALVVSGGSWIGSSATYGTSVGIGTGTWCSAALARGTIAASVCVMFSDGWAGSAGATRTL